MVPQLLLTGFVGLMLSVSPEALAEPIASRGRCIDYFTAHRVREQVSPRHLCNDDRLLEAMTHPNFDRCIRWYETHPSHGRDDAPSWRCRSKAQLDQMDELESLDAEALRRQGGERKTGQRAPAVQGQSDRARSNRNDGVASESEGGQSGGTGSKPPSAAGANSN